LAGQGESERGKGNRGILLYPVILSEKVLKFVVAELGSADIITLMSKNITICSVLKAATSLSSLLLRRLAL